MKRIFFLFVLIIPIAVFGQKSFSTGTFEKEDQYQLVGSAKIIDGNIQLTDNEEWVAGACWYKNKLKIDHGFEVEFQMIIDKVGGFGGKGADGLAFVISNDPDGYKVGENGEGLGYQGIRNCLVVEFDTFDNEEGGNNHVSIHTNGKGKVSRYNDNSIAINHKIPPLRHQINTVKITYDFKDVRVFINKELYIKKTVHLEKIIKLDKGKAWIGFTASTAGAYSQHRILNLKFKKHKLDLVYLDKDVELYGNTPYLITSKAVLRKRIVMS